jgi:hypothetical protein
MRIPLSEAIRLLQNAAGIILDDDIIMYSSVDDDPKAIHFLELRWDVEGLGYEADFARADHETVEVEDGKLILQATDAAVYEITLLEKSSIPEEPAVSTLEVGKLYKTRDGRVAWVCSRDGIIASNPFIGLLTDERGVYAETWTGRGLVYDDREHAGDLVEEYDGPFQFAGAVPANYQQQTTTKP